MQAKSQSDAAVAGRQAVLQSATGQAIVATPTNSDFPVAMDKARELARVPPMNGPQPIGPSPTVSR
jgi:hypothetical protein